MSIERKVDITAALVGIAIGFSIAYLLLDAAVGVALKGVGL